MNSVYSQNHDYLFNDSLNRVSYFSKLNEFQNTKNIQLLDELSYLIYRLSESNRNFEPVQWQQDFDEKLKLHFITVDKLLDLMDLDFDRQLSVPRYVLPPCGDFTRPVDPNLIQDENCRTVYINLIQQNQILGARIREEHYKYKKFKNLIYTIKSYFNGDGSLSEFATPEDFDIVIHRLLDEVFDVQQKKDFVRLELGI